MEGQTDADANAESAADEETERLYDMLIGIGSVA